jgi:hypothetical protein
MYDSDLTITTSPLTSSAPNSRYVSCPEFWAKIYFQEHEECELALKRHRQRKENSIVSSY